MGDVQVMYDLSLNVPNTSLCIYADNTTQVVAGHNVMEMASTLEKDLRSINKWVASNRMALNA